VDSQRERFRKAALFAEHQLSGRSLQALACTIEAYLAVDERAFFPRNNWGIELMKRAYKFARNRMLREQGYSESDIKALKAMGVAL